MKLGFCFTLTLKPVRGAKFALVLEVDHPIVRAVCVELRIVTSAGASGTREAYVCADPGLASEHPI
jgi:hypothetical protein